MRVPVRLKMPRGSTLKGDGDYNPATGEVQFSARTASEIEVRLQRSSAEPCHIVEAVAGIDGKELPLRFRDDRWIVEGRGDRRKQQAKRWEIPPPAPRWEIPHLRHRADSSEKHPAQRSKSHNRKSLFIRFKGLLKLWDS